MITRENILDLKPRQEIYSFIFKNPGLHLREISRKMKIMLENLRFHLLYLEKQNLIVAKSKNGYKRYYIKDKFGNKEKEIINILMQEVPRNILLYMEFFLICSQIELSKEFLKHPSTINYHLKKLKELDIIDEAYKKESKITCEYGIIFKRDKTSYERTFMFKDMDALNIIYKLLIVCKNNLPDRQIINDLLLIQKELFNRSKKDVINGKSHFNKKINTFDYAMDNVLNFWTEFFPNPYIA